MIKEEAKIRNGQAQLSVTVKEYALEAEPGCPNISVLSVCDTKPVHFILTSTDIITCIEKTKYVSPTAKKHLDPLKFLCFNQFYDYNENTKNINITDHMRKVYCIQFWLRYQKW